jgi:hypothetical protein
MDPTVEHKRRRQSIDDEGNAHVDWTSEESYDHSGSPLRKGKKAKSESKKLEPPKYNYKKLSREDLLKRKLTLA